MNIIQFQNETNDLFLSITKNCETLIEQTHKKAEETREFELTKSGETFHFNPPVELKKNWMVGLRGLEVYNSIFNTTQENNNFELYAGYLDDEVSYNQFKDNIAEILGLPNITPEELTFGPKIFEIYRKLSR